jgi:hypothetical protein
MKSSIRFTASSRGKDRTGRGQLEIDDQLVAVRRRKELPVDLAETQIGQRERPAVMAKVMRRKRMARRSRADRRAGNPARRRLDRTCRRRLQQHRPQDRREQDRHEPRGDQRDRHHLEQRDGVFAALAFREADRHEARDGDERADQHRRGKRPVGKACRRLDRCRPPQAAQHGVHRGHRVIDQQRQRDDQRAKRHPLQVDLHGLHDEEHDGQSHRDRNGDHRAGPHPQRRKLTTRMMPTACQSEVVKSPIARSTTCGLVGNQEGSIPTGRSASGPCHRRVTSSPSSRISPPSAHGNRQRDGALAVYVQQGLRRVDEAAPHGRDVAEPDRARPLATSVHLQHVGLGGEGPRHAQGEVLGARVDHTRGAHHVLRRDGVEDLAVVQPHGRHAVGLELDQDLFVLHAHPLDLADPIDLAQQAGSHDIDAVAQLAVGKAVGGEGVDDAEDIAEIVVEERPEHALRQGVADVADAVAHLLPDLGARVRAGRHLQDRHRSSRSRDG